MRTLLPLLFLLVVGCRERWEAPPLHVSPCGLKVYVPPVAERDYGVDRVLYWADEQAKIWIRDRVTWGLEAYTEYQLWEIARLYPIIGYDTWTVPGDGRGVYGGFNWYGSRIEVSVSPQLIERESVVGFELLGFPVLPHEFTHSVLGDFH